MKYNSKIALFQANFSFHLRIVDGVVDAADSEGGGEVGGVAAHDQQHEQPPGGRHHPARHGPAQAVVKLRGGLFLWAMVT